MNTRTTLAGTACLLLSSLQPATATTINYDVSNISGNTWEYNYTVINDTLGFNINAFTIFFDSGIYHNLSLSGVPAIPDWDPIVVQPDNVFNNDGWYDVLDSVNGITPVNSLSGFSVHFEFIGTGTPGSQIFDIVDPNNYSIPFESGQTSLVPVPAAVWLFGSGLISLISVARRKKA